MEVLKDLTKYIHIYIYIHTRFIEQLNKRNIPLNLIEEEPCTSFLGSSFHSLCDKLTKVNNNRIIVLQTEIEEESQPTTIVPDLVNQVLERKGPGDRSSHRIIFSSLSFSWTIRKGPYA